MALEEIRITEIGNVRIGNAENKEAATGCTVLIFEKGATAGLDVRGGGPASRESELLKPMAACEAIHAVLLSGGSAYGLDAAGGVMQFLEEKNIGFPVGPWKVPLVCESCLLDLSVGDGRIRPDQAMGYAACEAAYENRYADGNVGAGTGATVGKMWGGQCMKSGIGSYAVKLGPLMVGAVVAVNSLGDIYDWKTGEKAAGLLSPDGDHFVDIEEQMLAQYEAMMLSQGAKTAAAPEEKPQVVENTAIGVILTNGKFSKAQLCKIAGMAHDGFARSIRPVHTSMDGDSIYAVSLGDVPADQDITGILAARVMSEAILRAVKSAGDACGLSGAASREKK